MSTAIDLINQALIDIGATSPIKPVAPESQNTAFTRLVQMLNKWTAKGINLGDSFVLPTSKADELGNDADTDLAIIQSLSLLIATPLRRELSIEQKSQAADSYQDLLISSVARPEMPYPSTMPGGAGRRNAPFARRYYSEPVRKDTQAVEPDQQ